MILDTFQNFIKHWDGNTDSYLSYIKNFPELFEKIKKDYGPSWKDYLRLLSEIDIKDLRQAHESLKEALSHVSTEIEKIFGVSDDTYNIVIYIGLENGAGWVTEYAGKPSILFGLEAIAKLKWQSKAVGLAAHEFGHLVHWFKRNESTEKFEDDPILWLYTEGFAQKIEDMISGRPWHLEYDNWFEWCTENEVLLKREFARRIEKKMPLNPFFGSWYEIFGMKFTGYYLGYKFIDWLEESLSLDQIGVMDKENIKRSILKFLSF